MLIGLTGGIATGKSTVCKILEDLEVEVIDADIIAHRVLDDKKVIKKLKNEFGKEILNENGRVDRKKLGEIVFKDKKKLEKLESFTHPKIFEIIEHKLSRTNYKDHLVVLDAPLLFETSLDEKVDETWVVYANKYTQINRMKDRDNLSEKEALQRINAQMSLDDKVEKADIVINNEGTIQELRKKIEKLVENRS